MTNLGLVTTAILLASTMSVHAEQKTRLFGGIVWTFGSDGGGPSARFGAIHTNTSTQGNVRGARTYLDFKLDGRGEFPSLVMTGFAGDTGLVGELGAGYDFASGQFFGQVGAMINHAEFGLTYGFSGNDLRGFMGVNTIKFDEVDGPEPSDTPPLLGGGADHDVDHQIHDEHHQLSG